MRLVNFWLLKCKEKNLLKIVEYAQKNNKKVETLSKTEVLEALKAMR